MARPGEREKKKIGAQSRLVKVQIGDHEQKKNEAGTQSPLVIVVQNPVYHIKNGVITLNAEEHERPYA